MNSQRDFIIEICREEGIKLDMLSFGYVLSLEKENMKRHIFGAYWDINSAAADRIACDKTACYNLLNTKKISAIPHVLVFNPLRRSGFIGDKGFWKYACDYFLEHNKKLVVKPNQGTKGENVFFCDTISALETAIQTIFLLNPDAALSPYHEVVSEYRVFYLDGKCYFVYGKEKGNSWQHNLSQGAKAFELKSDDEIKKLAKIENIAIKAASCININFATVDVALTSESEYKIMEINSGVQAKQLLEQLPHLRNNIKTIYQDAIKNMF